MIQFLLFGLGAIVVGAAIFAPFTLLLSRLGRRKHEVHSNHALHVG
jgi:hypothetical protein